MKKEVARGLLVGSLLFGSYCTYTIKDSGCNKSKFYEQGNIAVCTGEGFYDIASRDGSFYERIEGGYTGFKHYKEGNWFLLGRVVDKKNSILFYKDGELIAENYDIQLPSMVWQRKDDLFEYFKVIQYAPEWYATYLEMYKYRPSDNKTFFIDWKEI